MQKTGIIVLFVLYWLFAIVKGLEVNLNINNDRVHTIVNLLTPPSYRMFIGPYKTNLVTLYTFYKGDKILETIDTDSYFNSHIKEELPFSNKTFRLSVGIDYSNFYIDLEYQKKFDELTKKNIDRKSIDKELDKMLSTDVEIKKHFKTLVNFHKVIMEDNNKLKQATKVKMQFQRIPIRLDYKDPMAYADYNITYGIGKKIIYEETVAIK